jgi:glycosyltransferase involved in cell wall biosynthesis
MDGSFPKSGRVDIMLLLEGTFPYVSGGVSSWVNQIIRGFPEYRFGALFIGSSKNDYTVMKYKLPENLVHLDAFYIHDPKQRPSVRRRKGNPEVFREALEMHECFLRPDAFALEGRFMGADFYLDSVNGIDFGHFLHARRSWDIITELYHNRCTDPSFVDYFWTVRNMHTPIWLLAEVAGRLPAAGLYHTVSTGYAGFLGSLLHHDTGRPLVLSEHGIYTKERRIDIFNSDWIQDNRNALQKDPTEISYYRDLWIRFFETLGRFCYSAAGNIVSLFEGARRQQISDGAPASRTRVIPNGINVERFLPLRREHTEGVPQVLVLLGRVVPIKDIKTFIRAVCIVAGRLPTVEGWIVGPDDEDPEYAAECISLTGSLGLADRIKFLGFRNPMEIFPQTGALVLSSISEGLPLVLLEAFAAGIPAVATDVGSCRQLIMGEGAEDEAIGPAGGVVDINNPQALAEESLRLLTDRGHWERARQSAINRVERFYTHQRMFDGYRELYRLGML